MARTAYLPTPSSFTAALFDLDGTLLDYEGACAAGIFGVALLKGN